MDYHIDTNVNRLYDIAINQLLGTNRLEITVRFGFQKIKESIENKNENVKMYVEFFTLTTNNKKHKPSKTNC